MKNRADYDRVTTILSVLKDDLEMVRRIKGPDFLEMKAAMGTEVHHLADLYNQSRIVKAEFYLSFITETAGINPESAARANLYVNWANENVEEVICSEQQIFLDSFHVRGTLDIIVRMKGDTELTVMDIKNCAAISPKVKLQLAAYKLGAEAAGLKIGRRIALQITDTVKAVEFTEHKRDEKLFLFTVELFRNLK